MHITKTEKAQVLVVKASMQELDEVAQLFDEYRQFYGKKPDFAVCRMFIHDRLIRDESLIFIAVQNEPNLNNIIGFMQLYPAFSSISLKHMWILNDLYVVDSARGHGVGKQLVDRAKLWAKETDSAGLVLETAKTNLIAQNLYSSAGFCKDEIFNRYCYTTQ